MAGRAQVTSVEAIEAFRANLLIYLSKARPAIDEVSSEVMRTRLWVQEDQRRFWENQHRIRSRRLERAQAELSSARMSLIQTATSAQQMEVRRALQAVREAESKLALLRKWNRELENRTAPLLKQVEQLQGFLSADLTRAVAYLAQVIKTLEDYAAVAPGSGPAPASAPPPEATPPEAGNAAPASGAQTAESAPTEGKELADKAVRAPEPLTGLEQAEQESERRSPTRQEPLADDRAHPEIGVPDRNRPDQEQRADEADRAPGATEGGAA